MARPSISDAMNQLDFVTWDRCIVHDYPLYADPLGLTVYGWIARDDGRSDFVVLESYPWEDRLGYTTSSARYSAEIHRRLYGSDDGHTDCQRVADSFLSDLVARKVT